MHPKRRGEVVANARCDLGAFGNTNERRRHLERPGLLPERFDAQSGALIALRKPGADAGSELQREHTVGQRACRMPIVVDDDCRWIAGASTLEG